jgi:PIN domain nuclease of toxin-antitoxin system
LHLLLDTHALLWWLAGERRISRRARAAIADPDARVHVSAASAWEISTKFRLGKLPGAAAIVHDIPGVLTSQAFLQLPISVVHAQRAGALPGEHRDPFDRMLIAQALCEGLTLVTREELFARYGVPCLW